MSVFRTSSAVVAAAGLLALGACTSGGGSTGSSTAGSTGAVAGGPITVTATDTECTVSVPTAGAGTITFQVKNTGSKVNEFYLYGAGDRIISEVENITPGLTRELKVEVTEPGTFQTACKPGMVGDGIRAAFTVTGTAQPGSADQKVAKAIADYKAYVAAQSAELSPEPRPSSPPSRPATSPRPRRSTRPRGSRGSGSSRWRSLRRPRPEDRRPRGRRRARGCPSPATTDWRRTSGSTGSKADSSAIADQLLADVKTIVEKAATAEFTALSIANGAKELLDEVATTQDHRRGGAVLAYRPRRHEGEPPGLAGRARGAAPGHHRASARPGGGARPDVHRHQPGSRPAQEGRWSTPSSPRSRPTTSRPSPWLSTPSRKRWPRSRPSSSREPEGHRRRDRAHGPGRSRGHPPVRDRREPARTARRLRRGGGGGRRGRVRRRVCDASGGSSRGGPGSHDDTGQPRRPHRLPWRAPGGDHHPGSGPDALRRARRRDQGPGARSWTC